MGAFLQKPQVGQGHLASVFLANPSRCTVLGVKQAPLMSPISLRGVFLQLPEAGVQTTSCPRWCAEWGS